MKYIDKIETTVTDKGEYKEVVIIIKELYSIGGIIFKTPLEVRAYIYQSDAHIEYDFGMNEKISISKDNNVLYNYTNNNPECDPIKTIISTVKFDLMHAFFHYTGDPNYTHTHWALVGNLEDRAIVFDLE